MKIVLDTNVLVSGIFFSGAPSKILEAWDEGAFELVISPEILEEYRRVVEELSSQYPSVEAGRNYQPYPLAITNLHVETACRSSMHRSR